MALARIAGPMLTSNLERQGVDLAIDANLIYASVSSRMVGINNASPAYALDSPGNARISNLYILGNAISSNTGKVGLGAITSVGITGGQPYDLLYTDGNGNLNFGNLNSLSGLDAFTGNNIALGSNTAGYLVSNAVTLTTSTSVTNAVAQLNYVLGKLVPPSPPTFPGNVATSVGATSTFSITTGTSSGIMTGDAARGTGWTQQNNISGNTYQLSGGTTFSAIRANTYATSTLAAIKSGQGNVRVWLGGNVLAGYINLTGSLGTVSNGNLTITNDTDYHNIVSSVAGGFWYSANVSASGSSIPPGWNTVTFENFGGYTTGNTNALLWYNDISGTPAGTPTFSNTSAALTSNSVIYSSTIPHFTNSTIFRLKGNVSNLSGDTYPAGNVNLTSTTGASGAFATPTAVTYAGSIGPGGWTGTVPLPRYFCNSTNGSGGSVYYETNASITSGFGSSSAGPTLTVTNGYSTSSATAHSPGATILYKTGTGTAIDETTIATTTPIGVVSGGSYRIVYSQSSDTPTAVTGSESVWSSAAVASGGTPLGLMDATVVGNGTSGRIQFDTNNYSTGYLPVGPNLSGQNATQYFTMRFAQAGVTTFYLNYTGIVAGIFCAMPGTGGTNGTNVSNGTWNGWLSAGILNSGGVPGPGSAGNGSAGCVTGAVPTFGSLVTSGSGSGKMQIYFGTTNSTSATNNMIYIRFKLTTGQYISALSITAA